MRRIQEIQTASTSSYYLARNFSRQARSRTRNRSSRSDPAIEPLVRTSLLSCRIPVNVRGAGGGGGAWGNGKAKLEDPYDSGLVAIADRRRFERLLHH